MARSTVQQTIDAADTLFEWLQSQRGAPVDGPGPPAEEATRQERASADNAVFRDGFDKTAAPEAGARAGQGRAGTPRRPPPVAPRARTRHQRLGACRTRTGCIIGWW